MCGTVKRPVLSEAELDADAKTSAEMKKYLRQFRYAYIGVGVQGSDVKQNGVSSSSTNYGGSMGIDSDGLVNPLTLELSGKFYGGSGTSFGETFMMVYGEFPISADGGLPWSVTPGDVVLTGTPAGVGPLFAGDRIEVEVGGVGVLSKPVAAFGAA